MLKLGSLIVVLSVSIGCRSDKLDTATTDTASEIVDIDGDGFADFEDCDDNDENINPSAEELCDGVDNDCDDEIDEGVQTLFYVDADADGYGAEGSEPVEACEAPEGMVELEGDCDDTSDLYHPSASEEDCADPEDYNCDGSVGYADEDGDGYAACQECDDFNPMTNPDADEYCDGVDNDCDTEVDEDDSLDSSTWYADTDGDSYGDMNTTNVTCYEASGWVADSTDCDDSVASTNPGADEYCDGVDNDCDTEIDEDDSLDASTWYADTDGDSYGDMNTTNVTCYEASGWVADSTDCDDSVASTNPGADEYCDGADNDCDTEIDEDDSLDASTWYADTDGDSFGDLNTTNVTCYIASGWVADSTDCDDAEATTNPSAGEYCDGVDNDCDAEIDEDDSLDASTWYADSDSDGFGDLNTTNVTCYIASGWVSDNTDCDDAEATTYPSADEYCDGVDNDCDTETDEDDSLDASTWYADGDGDSYGDLNTTNVTCYIASGWVADNTDCDDSETTTNPAADEYCDGHDDDCDGDIDEDSAVDASTWYFDIDGDLYGDPLFSLVQCYQPTYYVADNTDCSPALASINPGADEYCDGVDNDCDTFIDEDDALDVATWYADSDGDGYGDLNTTNATCYIANGWVADSSDCDDLVYMTNPGASEYCDGVDNNCDGTIDEDSAVDAVTWYADTDGDGYGDSSVTTISCYGSSAWISDSTDCNDTTADSNPSAYEIIDLDDNDCDGTTDESIVAVIYAAQCLANDGHVLYTAEESTAYEHDRVEIYVNDMGYGLDRYDEILGAGTGADLTVYEVVMFADCGWSWSTANQVVLDELLDARDLGISTFAWGDDLGWSCSNVTGEEELTLVEGCYSNGTTSAGVLTMSGSTHAAYLGPYGTPVDFQYTNDMDEVSAWAGTTVLAYNSVYGSANPAWSAYEDSLNGSRAISLETSIYMSNHDQVTTAAEAELEIIFKNSLSWLLAL